MLGKESKKQKPLRISELCQIPKYAREQFAEDSRQSINFVFSRKQNPVRKMDSSVPCCAENVTK